MNSEHARAGCLQLLIATLVMPTLPARAVRARCAPWQVDYNDSNGKLTVHIKSARDLKIGRGGVVPNPYVKVRARRPGRSVACEDDGQDADWVKTG